MSEIDFETRISKIEEIIKALEQKDVKLKDGIKLYKDGLAELKAAQDLLENAKLDLEEIK
ncbi:MAG: exodeoxyribonuclease VII small subunit [Helicobacter sp.]|nr:exodeoxyribonuclease VII small subunit [Helicobacter sp.]